MRFRVHHGGKGKSAPMEVRFEHVIKQYGTVTAVKDLNLTIKKGALHFLLGPSGCGKTTTLRMLAGLESVSQGRILFDGLDVTHKPAALRGIGMVFQNYALWPHMTVRQNIEYGLKIRKISGNEAEDRIKEALEITQLKRFAKRLPGQLSGGQQQRVALARALVIRPNVLLLDEPLSNLDAKLRLEMRDNITRIHRETGLTTLYVTHDQKEALSMGTQITVMHAGVEIQTGSARELYLRPGSSFLAEFIGETNLIEGTYLKQADNTHQIDTGLGLLHAGICQHHFHQGDRVLLSVRPESIKIDLGRDSVPQDNPLNIRLRQMTYLGDLEQMEFIAANGQALKVNLFNAPEHGLREGDETSCFIRPSKISVLPPEQNLGPQT